jgi:hypothetical protein
MNSPLNFVNYDIMNSPVNYDIMNSPLNFVNYDIMNSPLNFGTNSPIYV